jgi:micrococcal nuclease
LRQAWEGSWGWTEPAPGIARVERIVDGDTVVVRLDGRSTRIRLIGVDTPESVDPRRPVERFGREATAFLKELVEGRSVRVEFEPGRSHRDRYGRTLAYLYRQPDGLFVNLEIVARGFGHAYVKYPFTSIDEFRAAERQAREQRRGLWAPVRGRSRPSPPGSRGAPGAAFLDHASPG